MEDLLIKSQEHLYELQTVAKEIREMLVNKSVPNNVKDAFDSYDISIDNYNNAIDSEDSTLSLLECVKTIAIYAANIGYSLTQSEDFSTELKVKGDEIISLAREIQDPIERRPVVLDQVNREIKGVSFKSIKNDLQEIKLDHERHDERIKKLLGENESKISLFEEKLKLIEAEVNDKLSDIERAYTATISTVTDKKEQIDKLLSHASGKTIAGDFEKSAIDERGMANWLRRGALLCMAMIVCVVGYSFWETTTDTFQWENSVFRVVLALMLSVPAAYLARESAKHREQQYSHLQTSLDLKSITPYMASLPEDEQHKLKVEIANRIFASRDYSKVSIDSYPINVHEMVMEIIKKVELPSGTKQSNKIS
ncbi:TPA: hypothetical protein ACOJRH_005079 [Vibrio harveyi]|uniref:hypothetical protein n=1 Tax=Vibrio harveyi TaxID=669 RepID=UPI00390AC281